MRKFLLLLLSLTAFIGQSDAQVVGLKSNLLYSATASPNLGVEIGMGPQTTLDISAGFNPFKFSHNRQWRHWLVQPEFRWWTCERFGGHFLAGHLIGGGFNVGLALGGLFLLYVLGGQLGDLRPLRHHLPLARVGEHYFYLVHILFFSFFFVYSPVRGLGS